MGKERDKLLWSLGEKPSQKTEEEALEEYNKQHINAGKLPPHLQETLDAQKQTVETSTTKDDST